jgi:hypothetical protein
MNRTVAYEWPQVNMKSEKRPGADMNTEPSREVADAVANALANALENGHDFEGWSDDQIADDMMEFDADVAEMPRGLVVTAIHGLRT